LKLSLHLNLKRYHPAPDSGQADRGPPRLFEIRQVIGRHSAILDPKLHIGIYKQIQDQNPCQNSAPARSDEDISSIGADDALLPILEKGRAIAGIALRVQNAVLIMPIDKFQNRILLALSQCCPSIFDPSADIERP
jgi:hypothetical protein